MDNEMTEPVLRVSGVTKKYRLGQFNADTLQEEIKLWRERRRGGLQADKGAHSRIEDNYIYALNGVDLTVGRGERVGIIGRNGAGKSTLLKLISRITLPTSGRIQIWGRVASMLEVGTGFHGDMTGRENIYLNGAILGMSRSEIDRKMEDIISFSEVRDFIDTPVKRYSSGMFVKLGFAVAAHLDSEILIMDEVLAVGDMEFQHKCLDKMRTAARDENKAILYVSHNMNTIRRLCDRCVVMDEGKIVFDGDVDKAVAIYLGTDSELRRRTEFTQAYRPYDQWLRINLRLNLDSLEVMKDTSAFAAGETVEMRVRCTAYKKIPRAGLRMELWSQDGTKIGTMLSGSFSDLEEGENTLVVKMDTAHLAPGQYRADMVAFCHDGDGNEDILDGVYPGLVFRIDAVKDEENYLDWHHDYWGSVRLHDLSLKRE